MTRAHRKFKEATEPKVVKEAVELEEEIIPVPEGIVSALKTKLKLHAYLIKFYQHDRLSVSLEVEDDQWILVCRGCKPEFKFYAGYKVAWVPSHYLWTETKSL